MPRPISALSNDQLASFRRNYDAKGVETGGLYSLAEIKLELLRRTPSELDPRKVSSRIIELARGSEDGLVTYGELWQDFHPGATWRGNADQQVIGNALARVVAYCIDQGLPVVTALVVQKSGRKLSDQAIDNIFNEARDLGVETGPNARQFVDNERERALKLTSIAAD